MPDCKAEALLEMRGIVKTFPGVRALDGVGLTLYPGEVLALMGENGAGKSTLMKVLSGVYTPDAGEILIENKPVVFGRPSDAQASGISVIYQELDLIPQLTVRENLFLGRESSGMLGMLDTAKEREEAHKHFAQLGVSVGLETRVEALAVAEQQFVEIAKALAVDAKIVVMDEPTAALSHREVQRLFGIIRELKSKGIGVIYISHRLEEVEHIADRVTVLRDGSNAGELDADNLRRDRIIRMMVGRPVEAEFPKVTAPRGGFALEVNGLTRLPKVRDVSFQLRSGEVLGLTGLVGAGRTELVRLIFGAERADSGGIKVHGKSVRISNPRDAMHCGICLLTEDRKHQGLVLNRSVRENFGLPNLRQFKKGPFIDEAAESRRFAHYVQNLNIKVAGAESIAANLSGGNQQKVVLAKWLQRNADIIIFDEPTRGIDVGAKYEIYELMNQLAAEGKAIVMISSELPEALGMSDRILVMRDGEISGEIKEPARTSPDELLQLAMHEE